LLPATGLAAGNNGLTYYHCYPLRGLQWFYEQKKCFAGESYDLHARRLCRYFFSAV
jgi:hypothetical protein